MIETYNSIEAVFGLKSLDEVITVLSARRDAWAVETLKAMKGFSPTSLRVTFAHLTRARGRDLADVLKTEFRLVQHFMMAPDFFEGVRAQLVDKDGAPKWQPSDLAGVTAEAVEAYFCPLSGDQGLGAAGPVKGG